MTNTTLPVPKMNVEVTVQDNEDEPKSEQIRLMEGDTITFTITADVFGKVEKKVVSVKVL
jgi:hypothetical protein